MTQPVRTRHPWLLPMMTLALMAGILLGRGAPAWQGAAAALAASLLYAYFRHGRKRAVGAMLAALSLGCVLSWAAYHPAIPQEGEHRITGVLTGAVEPDERGHIAAILRDVMVDGKPWPGGAYWSCYLEEEEPLPPFLQPGAHLAMTARIYAPSGQANPSGFSFREYLLQQDVRFGIYGRDDLALTDGGFSLEGLLARIRHDLYRRMQSVMGPEAGSYAGAMLLGLQEDLPAADLAAFDVLGVTHILSISGYHVGVLAMMLAVMLRPMQLRRSHALLLRSAILLGYCLLTGGRAPVFRAALLSVLFEMARVRHRQVLPLHGLCTAASVQLLFNPTLLTSASFQLTYSAMVGLLLLRPRIARLFHPEHPLVQRFWQACSACLGAQLGVVPALLYWFGRLPLLTLAANLFIPALFTLLLGLYWATLLTLWLPGVRTLLGALSAWATGLLMSLLRPLGEIQGGYLWTRQPDLIALTGFALLAVGLLTLLPRRYARLQRGLAIAGALLALTVLIPLPHPGTTYIQFSVGDADAALLHDRDTVVVIDAGEDGGALASYLHDRRLTVDRLIITHLHSDHAGGIADLLGSGIPVRHCYLPVDATVPSIDPGLSDLLAELARTGTQMHQLSRGDVLPLPSGQLTVLWPEEGRTRPGDDANNASLALLAEVCGTKLLLTGDLTGAYEHYAAVPADVLKAAHHGSAASTGEAFLDAVSPQAILLSCGSTDREDAFTTRAGDVPVYSTHSSGAITIHFSPDSYRICPFLSEP